MSEGSPKIYVNHPETEADWRRVRELNALTGRNGSPIEKERFEFFGENWIGPYQALRPNWTYVARLDAPDGPIVGYLTGCPDTWAYEREKWWRFDLPRALGILLGRWPRNGDTRRFLERFTRKSYLPETKFSAAAHARLRESFQAHLHINLDASMRGKRLGDHLCAAFFKDLRAMNEAGLLSVGGVHVYCGAGPLKFYERLGFKVLERQEFSPGNWVYLMVVAHFLSSGAS